MVAINTLPILLMSFIAIAITSTKAGELVIEYNSDNSPPRHPLFSCEIRSSVCRKAGHYTNLNYYPLNLDLFVCHKPILLKALYDYLDFDRKAWGEFVSTYYVTCPPSDKECWIKSQGMNPKLVQKVSSISDTRRRSIEL
ncbi:hypothetical protein NDA12_002172 [Ustilago hordei]|nr:hypothetical protein NDA15_003326 [Ustilago hordei]KAJ1589915.1 hypothetical protein NDA12_002172 [Ustilago hordei]